jgi:phosphonate transport system substrate-binding protein
VIAMQKRTLLAYAVASGAAALVGCGRKDADAPKVLRIAISPYQDAETIRTGTRALAGMILERMRAAGIALERVEISVGTSYSAVAEALAAGSADAGFISASTYVLFDREIDVLVSALRKAISIDSTDPRDWNGPQHERYTDGLATHYRSVLVTGPSPAGRALLARVKAGGTPSWEELSALSWSVMSPASASGYLFPSLWLKARYGKQLSDLPRLSQADSYTTSMARLASGQADIAAAYAHIRINSEAKWQTRLGGTAPIWEQTGIIGVTDPIFNDTVSVSHRSPLMKSEKVREALADALIETGKTKEGLAALKIIGHKGYARVKASDYDPERRVRDAMRK